MHHQNTRARASVALAAAGLVGLLSACGASGATGDQDLEDLGDKTGTITMMHHWAEAGYAPYFEQIARDYEAANPGVTVKVEALGNDPYKDKIRVLASSGDLPDIYFAWPGEYSQQFVRAGMATDLTSVLSADTEWGQTFSESALSAYVYDGKTYGVPVGMIAKFMMYDKQMFAEAGVEPPTTFDELLNVCRAIAANGHTPIGFGNQHGWPAIHYLTELNAQHVAKEQRDIDYAAATGEFTDPGYVAALEDFSALSDTCFPSDANAASYDSAQAGFAQGDSAMFYLVQEEIQRMAPDQAAFDAKYGIFVLPSADGTHDEITGAPDGFLVNAASEHKALAVDFLRFMTNAENSSTFVSETGKTSTVIGAVNAENSTEYTRDAVAQIDGVSSLSIWLDTVTAPRVAEAYLAGAEALLGGDSTPEDVMSSVREAAERVREDLAG